MRFVVIEIFLITRMMSEWQRFGVAEAFAAYQSCIFSARKWSAAHCMIWYVNLEEKAPCLRESVNGMYGIFTLTVVALNTTSRFRYRCKKSRTTTADRSATVAAKATAAADVRLGINLWMSKLMVALIHSFPAEHRTLSAFQPCMSFSVVE